MSDQKTVVVTGATGFVGRYVVDRLLQEGLAVKCMLRNSADAKSFTEHDLLSFCVGDITQANTMNTAFADAWGVINLAGLREFWCKDRDQFYQLNQHGAENVFQACLKQGIQRVIQVSTPLAFGVPKRLPFNELTPAGKHPSDYGLSKYLGDQAGQRLQQEHDLPLSIVYLAAVIGSGDDKSTMEVKRAVQERMPALVGADTTYTYLYVKDAAEAIVKTLVKEDAIGRNFLIGKERATTREYFNIIGELANVKVPSRNIPEALLIPVAIVMEVISKFSGKRPELPLDVIKTTAAGSLLFDASVSEKELGMQYHSLKIALGDAVKDFQKTA
jgi:dihydroflavonol-4-reductase